MIQNKVKIEPPPSCTSVCVRWLRPQGNALNRYSTSFNAKHDNGQPERKFTRHISQNTIKQIILWKKI